MTAVTSLLLVPISLKKSQGCQSVAYRGRSCFAAAAGAGDPRVSAEQDPAPGLEQGIGCHKAGQVRRRPAAWSLGRWESPRC